MTRASVIFAMLACLSLTACGSDQIDLSQFVAGIRARSPQAIDPMPQIRPYTPFAYQPAGRRSPFTPTLAPTRTRAGNGIAPNRSRPREVLEHYPLDALHMVGTIESGGVTYALISAPDNIIHRVSSGNHIGEHFGRIDSISEHGVTLTEIMSDGTGGYVKRGAALAPPG